MSYLMRLQEFKRGFWKGFGEWCWRVFVGFRRVLAGVGWFGRVLEGIACAASVFLAINRKYWF